MPLTEVATNMIISVAGIVGTVIMGASGLYFTARSRTSPNRQVLYNKQIELALKIFRTSGSAVNRIVLLLSENQFQDQAREDLTTLVAESAQLSYESAVLFPVELYVAFKRVSETMADLLAEYDGRRDITDLFDALQVADTRWALLARTLIGVTCPRSLIHS